jgi:hypothetical protein
LRAMRRSCPKRDQLLMRVGAAKTDAGRAKVIFSSSLRWTYRRSAGPFNVAIAWADCSSSIPESLDTVPSYESITVEH